MCGAVSYESCEHLCGPCVLGEISKHLVDGAVGVVVTVGVTTVVVGVVVVGVVVAWL